MIGDAEASRSNAAAAAVGSEDGEFCRSIRLHPIGRVRVLSDVLHFAVFPDIIDVCDAESESTLAVMFGSVSAAPILCGFETIGLPLASVFKAFVDENFCFSSPVFKTIMNFFIHDVDKVFEAAGVLRRNFVIF